MLSYEEIVNITNSVEAYQKIIQDMFSDGICNEGRLITLLLYTQTICSRYPEMSDDIMSEYSKFLSKLKKQKTPYCIIL